MECGRTLRGCRSRPHLRRHAGRWLHRGGVALETLIHPAVHRQPSVAHWHRLAVVQVDLQSGPLVRAAAPDPECLLLREGEGLGRDLPVAAQGQARG
ncbi:MAG: hypothetical protein ACK55I_10920, partial [bacterium]